MRSISISTRQCGLEEIPSSNPSFDSRSQSHSWFKHQKPSVLLWKNQVFVKKSKNIISSVITGAQTSQNPWTPFWNKSGWQWCWSMIPDHLPFSIWVPEESLGSHSPWKFCKMLVAHDWVTCDIENCPQLLCLWIHLKVIFNNCFEWDL